MAYASSRHAVRRLAAEAARGARARRGCSDRVPSPARRSLLSPSPRVDGPVPRFRGGVSASPWPRPRARVRRAALAGARGSARRSAEPQRGVRRAVQVAARPLGVKRGSCRRAKRRLRRSGFGEVRAAARRSRRGVHRRARGGHAAVRAVRAHAPRVRSVHGSPMPGALLITAVRRRGSVNGSRLSRQLFRGEERGRGRRRVLVNRGWVPEGRREPEGGACLRATGVTRASETPGVFTPANDPATRRFHWVDVPAIARRSLAGGHVARAARGGEWDRGTPRRRRSRRPRREDLRAFKVAPEDHELRRHPGPAATGGALHALAGAGRAPPERRGAPAAAARVVR